MSDEQIHVSYAEGFGELVDARAPGEVRAEFHKLLVYEEGGFFLAHRD